MPGSPLATVALFTEIIRERFRPGNGLSWEWAENPTPPTDENAELGAPRKILIEPAFSTLSHVRNYRPAIFIDKGITGFSKDIVNNFVGQQLNTGLKGYWALATIPMDIEVLADRKGESATLADIVWFYLVAGIHEIRATFGIHDISNPVLGPTTPAEVDKTVWSTRVNFQIQVEFRWSKQPVGPLLREIVTRYRQSGITDPDEFLLEKYLR